MCLAAPVNFGGFAAVRFLLGFTEGLYSDVYFFYVNAYFHKAPYLPRL